MYTEFKNANSNIAELLQYVKRGVAFDHAEGRDASVPKCVPNVVQSAQVEVLNVAGML